MLRKQIMQDFDPFNLMCSIYSPSIKEYIFSPNDILNLMCSIYPPSIKEYVCSPNDVLSDCSPINTFSLKYYSLNNNNNKIKGIRNCIIIEKKLSSLTDKTKNKLE